MVFKERLSSSMIRSTFVAFDVIVVVENVGDWRKRMEGQGVVAIYRWLDVSTRALR